jgi:hypothetical protein
MEKFFRIIGFPLRALAGTFLFVLLCLVCLFNPNVWDFGWDDIKDIVMGRL